MLAHANRPKVPQIEDVRPWSPSVPHAILDKLIEAVRDVPTVLEGGQLTPAELVEKPFEFATRCTTPNGA